MAKIIPFKAVRPTPDKVSLVTSRSYDDYGAAELASHLEFNPFSFLHILNPAYVNQQKLGWEKRFKLVEHKYQDFKNEGILIQEESPAFYLYEIHSNRHTFTGILAGTSVEDYQKNIIRKHEDTLQYRVDLFKDYLHETGFNTEPVLITYKDNQALSEWIANKKKSRPVYEFSTTNKEKHVLWSVSDSEEINWLEKQFSEIGTLYIADGHHRSASSELLYKENKASGNVNLNYFMSFLIPDSNVKIYEYNRVISDLNGHSKDDFIKKIAKNFIIKTKKQELWKPRHKFEFGMYLDGEFYALRLKEEQFSFKNVLERLDAQILYDTILHPVLGLGDLRTDERIAYVPGTKSITSIKDMVDSGEFKVGFMLYPINIEEIKAIADLNMIMPPKSTYIEPKFRSGLVVYEL
ncbi:MULTISPECIES: DUF1015 domain-containing protein [Flavobacterium]|uniref:DUF1015 domain-containing protein n=1 Tax=Flavobacterium TaxID=237 RepID=UPI001FCC1F29|nr:MULTISPECIES: DUF1015 domain-containing protein [Flavobacterium]UOK42067.1 DUF1015 domain-containing protein [Flavobacterium enshiense]